MRRIGSADQYVIAQTGEYGNLMSKGIIDPYQGSARRPAGRGLRRRPSRDDGGNGRGASEEEGSADRSGRGDGRYGLLIKRAQGRPRRPRVPAICGPRGVATGAYTRALSLAG